MNCKKQIAFLLLLFAVWESAPAQKAGSTKPQKQAVVEMQTSLGNIRIVLYNETPQHRDNFLKLAESGYYDSLLFHRVIRNFMIQGGDPDSKHAKEGVMLGEGGPGYTVPAEFNPKLFHKKGALAAARESDLDNPTQASSGSQFYLVQGRVYNDSLLKMQANRITKMKLFNTVLNRPENAKLLGDYTRFAKAELVDSIKYINDQLSKQMDTELPNTPVYSFSPEQVAAYTTVGGTPHLDGSYTVFGEVTEGMEVIDKIAEASTDKMARPFGDIRILHVKVIQKP